MHVVISFGALLFFLKKGQAKIKSKHEWVWPETYLLIKSFFFPFNFWWLRALVQTRRNQALAGCNMEERLNAILQAGIQNQQVESGWASVRGRHKKTKDSRPRKIAYKLCLPLHLHCGCRKTQPWVTQNCRLVFIYFVNSIGHPWVTHSQHCGDLKGL